MNPIDRAYNALRGMERAVSGLLLIAYTRLGQDQHGEAIRVLDETIEQLANTPRFNSLIDTLARLSDWIEAGQVSDTRDILRELITKMGDEFHQEIIARQEMA